MTVRSLDKLLRPTSVAVVGASNHPEKLGHVMMRNLLAARPAGPVLPVNPRQESICGVLAYPTVESLPIVPDLAVIATPASNVPAVVRSLAKRGTRAAIVLADHTDQAEPAAGRTIRQAMLDAARPFALRILGPGSIGVMVPGHALNASLMHQPPNRGRIAFVSESRAMCAAVLDWAEARGIGFSHIVSVGACGDVDVADVLDVLAVEPGVSTILLYLSSVGDARKFLSAGRAAARTKRVIVLRGASAEAAQPQQGLSAGPTEAMVYDAAFRRAGMLQVRGVDELFDAVETLARARRVLRGDRLAVIANGRGPALLALETLHGEGGRQAELDATTISQLARIVPEERLRGNPVSLTATAPSDRYAEVIKTVAGDPNIDALLVIHAPVELADAVGAARQVIDATTKAPCTVLTSWMGAQSAAPARDLFAAAQMPTYDTPTHAVRAFMHIVRYQHSQEMLLEMPSSAPAELAPDRASARALLDAVVRDGRGQLTEPEAKALLAAYDIPVVPALFVRDTSDALRRAREIGFPVALKVVSPDVACKSDVGAVALDLESEQEVVDAIAAVERRTRRHCPHAEILGYSIQRMVRRPGAAELMIGVHSHPVFGPVIVFGEGGTRAAGGSDRAVALPPLNVGLARKLLARTRIFGMLQRSGSVSPVDIDAVCLTLMKLSQLTIDLPQMRELTIDPLSAGPDGVVVLDASAKLWALEQAGTLRLAIRPYPSELEETRPVRDGGSVLLRPIRPEDEASHYRFFDMLTAEDRELRFFNPVRELSREAMARLTQIDYDREMAFVAQARSSGAAGAGVEAGDTLGVVRCVFDADGQEAEYAISVRSDQKGRGIGRILMEKMIAYARSRGAHGVFGDVLPGNTRMLRLTQRLGFVAQRGEDPGMVRVRLDLAGSANTAPARE